MIASTLVTRKLVDVCKPTTQQQPPIDVVKRIWSAKVVECLASVVSSGEARLADANSEPGLAPTKRISGFLEPHKFRLFIATTNLQVNTQQTPCPGQPSPSFPPRARPPRTPSLSPMSSRSVPPPPCRTRDTQQTICGGGLRESCNDRRSDAYTWKRSEREGGTTKVALSSSTRGYLPTICGRTSVACIFCAIAGVLSVSPAIQAVCCAASSHIAHSLPGICPRAMLTV
jgi:hypothetical protein